MTRSLPNFLGVSIALHLMAAGLWQFTSPPSLGTPSQSLQLTLLEKRFADAETGNAAPPVYSAPRKTRQPAVNSVRSKHNPTQNDTETITANKDRSSVTIRTANGQDVKTSRKADQISAALLQRLDAYFEYPMIARRRGWEGEVTLRLRLEPDGKMSGVRVVQSSGYRVLDRSALQAAQNAAGVPEAAGWLEGRHFDMLVPVRYKLTGS